MRSLAEKSSEFTDYQEDMAGRMVKSPDLLPSRSTRTSPLSPEMWCENAAQALPANFPKPGLFL